MTSVSRRSILTAGLGAAAALVPGLGAPAVLAQAGPVTLKLGNNLPPSHSVNIRLREAVAAIAAETNNGLVITIFPSNQLGSDSDMMSQLRSGALEMATMPGTVLSTLIPQTSLTGLGFTFTDYAKVWAAMDGEVGDYIRRAIEKANLQPFAAVWDNGFRQITTSTRPIHTPADLKGFKIRVPVVPLWVSMFSALGAAPTSIPLSEAYSALQTRIADGQENPLALIDTAKFYEVQKYCSLTNHAWDGFWLLSGGKVWRTIPPDLQAVMARHLDAAARQQRDDIAKANLDLQRTIEAKGLVFNPVDGAPFQARLKEAGFYRQWRERFGPEAWGLLQRYAGDVG